MAWSADSLGRVLIFHKQKGFIHTATPFAVQAIKEYSEKRGISVEATTDSLAFTAEFLDRFGAVIFLNTNYRNGELLNRQQEAAFEAFIRKGRGFVGIHSAVPLNGAWELTVWPWYAELFGARFKNHPVAQIGRILFKNSTHASTLNLPASHEMRDEWYAIQAALAENVQVVAAVDLSSLVMGGGGIGERPMSWYHTFDGGRAWMTLIGHDEPAFKDSVYLAHVFGGILYAGGWDGPTSRTKDIHALPGHGVARGSPSQVLNFPERGSAWFEIRSISGRLLFRRHFEDMQAFRMLAWRDIPHASTQGLVYASIRTKGAVLDSRRLLLTLGQP